MPISGNILIDKIRITFPIATLTALMHTAKSYIEEAREILEQYYPRSAYSVSKSRGEIKITITPTRFKPAHNFTFTDTNLEMPSENWLLNLLLELGFKNRMFGETARIVLIHLTKNVVVNKPVHWYIKLLSSYPFARGYKPAYIYSSEDNATLSLATQKHNTEKADTNGDRMIIFYDKVRELLDKTSLKSIEVKEPLTDEDIAVLKSHEVYYNRRFRRLDLDNLNLLRCEQQYKYREKIKPLARFLNDNTNDVLTVNTLIELLKKESLYTKLNSFYIQQLKKIIFYNEPNTKQVQPLDNYQRSFFDLVQKADITELKLIYKVCGLTDNFNLWMKKFYKSKMNDLYAELYRKLCG